MSLAPPPRRLHRATLAALLLVLGASASARSEDGPSPAAAPAAPAPPAPEGPPIAAHENLDQIESVYDRLEEEARRSVRRRRYDAILGYVRAVPGAKDAEAAVAALFLVAAETEQWDRALLHADEYLAAWPHGKREVEARFGKARALARLERRPEARAAFESLTGAVVFAKHGRATTLAAWTARAQFLVEIGDYEGAKSVWRGMKTALQAAPDKDSLHRMADGEIAALEWIGRPAKAFPADARDLEGRPVALGDYAGKVLLIDFWATWCGPCKQEMPALVETWNALHERGFEVLGVSLDGANEGQRLREFVAGRGLPWKNVYYATGRNPVGEAYDVRALPFTILLGRDGRVLAVGVRGKELRKEVERALDAAPR